MVIRGGTGWRFDTPGLEDEPPKLVWNPEPLTSLSILTHFWENCGYLIQDYILHLLGHTVRRVDSLAQGAMGGSVVP